MGFWQGSVPITGTGSGAAYLELDTQVYQTGDYGWDIGFQFWYRVRNGYNVGRNARGGGNFGWSNGGPWDTDSSYPNDFEVFGSSFHIGLDANGYASYSLDGAIDLDFNSPYSTLTVAGSESLPRIGLAPPITSLIADNVKTTSARIGAEIGSYGHGTSAAFEAYYRVAGVGGYLSLGVQGDVGGYNYWNITGLTPGKTYEYYVRCYNNNGDQSQTGAQTFKTVPASGMISIMKGTM
jgi:hypothetical protein